MRVPLCSSASRKFTRAELYRDVDIGSISLILNAFVVYSKSVGFIACDNCMFVQNLTLHVNRDFLYVPS